MLPVLVLAIGVGWVARELVKRKRRARQCEGWRRANEEGARVPAGTGQLIPVLRGGDAPPRRNP